MFFLSTPRKNQESKADDIFYIFFSGIPNQVFKHGSQRQDKKNRRLIHNNFYYSSWSGIAWGDKNKQTNRQTDKRTKINLHVNAKYSCWKSKQSNELCASKNVFNFEKWKVLVKADRSDSIHFVIRRLSSTHQYQKNHHLEHFWFS